MHTRTHIVPFTRFAWVPGALATAALLGAPLAGQVPPPDGVVSGHVYLPDGATPAVGARVLLERVRTGGPYSIPPETQPSSSGNGKLEDAPRTDVDGSFEIPIKMRQWDRQPGVYVVRVDLQGFAPLRSEHVTAGHVVRLTLAAGQRIRGIVAGPDDEPMAGVRVTAYWTSYRKGGMRPGGAGQVASAETGPDGQYDLGPIGAGQYDVWATAPEMAPVGARDVRVSRDRPTEVDLFFAPPAELRGTIVYLGTTDPVEGVGVAVHLLDPAAAYLATTGADGKFRLTGLPEGDHVVDLHKGFPRAPRGVEMRNAVMRLNADGKLTVISGEVIAREILAPRRLTADVAEGEILEEIVEMSAGGSIEGRVVSEGGAPVEGACVDVVRRERIPEWDADGERTISEVATTDPEGRFRVDYLWPDNYQVRIREGTDRRGASQWVTVRDGEATRIDVMVGAP